MSIPTAPPSGFRDFLPEQVALRQDAIARIASVYRSFGFQQVATSAVEDLDVLMGKGGGENEKLIFKILKRGEKLDVTTVLGQLILMLENQASSAKYENEKVAIYRELDNLRASLQSIRNHIAHESSGLADLGLRFDLTLPLARYFSKHGSQLPHPFKAFNIGPVWRAERAQKGRYREFTQCDVDIIGADSWGAEVEVISAVLTVLKQLGLTGVTVHINDRALVYAALARAGVAENDRNRVCVAIDKLDKIEAAKVINELRESISNPNTLGAIERTFISRNQVTDYGDALPETFHNLLQIREAVIRANEYCPSDVIIEPSLMRGFDYYTGPVFEFRHRSLSGSLGGGGRYDRLTEKFGGQPIPACGGSIGFERLMLILEEMGSHSTAAVPDAVVTVFSDELRERSIAVACSLRRKGLAVDVFPGTGKLKNQFKYADQKKARFALVIGPDEAARGVVQVKELKTGDEQALTVDEACARIAAGA